MPHNSRSANGCYVLAEKPLSIIGGSRRGGRFFAFKSPFEEAETGLLANFSVILVFSCMASLSNAGPGETVRLLNCLQVRFLMQHLIMQAMATRNTGDADASPTINLKK